MTGARRLNKLAFLRAGWHALTRQSLPNGPRRVIERETSQPYLTGFAPTASRSTGQKCPVLGAACVSGFCDDPLHECVRAR